MHHTTLPQHTQLCYKPAKLPEIRIIPTPNTNKIHKTPKNSQNTTKTQQQHTKKPQISRKIPEIPPQKLQNSRKIPANLHQKPITYLL